MALTESERKGIETFVATFNGQTDFRLETVLRSLQPGGSVERMTGAPRREVLDAMQAEIRRELAQRKI